MDQFSYATTIFDKITTHAYNKTQYCLELPSVLSGYIAVGITAIWEDSSSDNDALGIVGGFQIAKGSCQGKKNMFIILTLVVFE